MHMRALGGMAARAGSALGSMHGHQPEFAGCNMVQSTNQLTMLLRAPYRSVCLAPVALVVRTDPLRQPASHLLESPCNRHAACTTEQTFMSGRTSAYHCFSCGKARIQPLAVTALTAALHPATHTDYMWHQVLVHHSSSSAPFRVTGAARHSLESRAQVQGERHCAIAAQQQAEIAAPSHQNLRQTEHSSCTHRCKSKPGARLQPAKEWAAAPSAGAASRVPPTVCMLFFKTFLTAAPMGTATLGGQTFLPRAALLYSSFSNSSSLATCGEQQRR